jgi:hypothetical protein
MHQNESIFNGIPYFQEYIQNPQSYKMDKWHTEESQGCAEMDPHNLAQQ